MSRSILFIYSPYANIRSEGALLASMADRHDIATRELPHDQLAAGSLGGALSDFDVVIAFLPSWRLREAPPLDWAGFAGERVLYDHDAIQNFSTVESPKLLGVWTKELVRHQFTHILCTSREVRDRFRAIGVAASWVPKGFDHRSFAGFEPGERPDAEVVREGIVAYGSRYPSRVIVEQALLDEGLPFERVQVPYPELALTLSRYRAALAVSAELPRLRLVRGSCRRLPARFMPITVGVEPMIKLFEIGAAGCVPIIDDIAELQALGFVDGESMISFQSIRALIKRLSGSLHSSQELQQMGEAAQRLCWDRHTWAHRADEIVAAFA